MVALSQRFQWGKLFRRNKFLGDEKIEKPSRQMREREHFVLFDLDNERAHRGSLPYGELLAAVEHDCRYVPSGDKTIIAAPSVGAAFGALLGFVPGYILQGNALGVLLAFPGVFFGALVGIGIFYPMFRRRPLWIMARSSGQVFGVTHSRFRDADIPDVVKPPEMAYEPSVARDIKESLKAGLSKFQKVALGMLVTLLVACLVALFLFVGAFGTGGK